eukprot:90664-Pelagomonas_calceolata.AAC.1
MGVWESIKKESVRTGRGKRGKERKGKKRHGMDGMDGKGREGCTGCSLHHWRGGVYVHVHLVLALSHQRQNAFACPLHTHSSTFVFLCSAASKTLAHCCRSSTADGHAAHTTHSCCCSLCPSFTLLLPLTPAATVLVLLLMARPNGAPGMSVQQQSWNQDAEPAALHMRVLVLSKALQCILQGQFQAILQGHTTRAYYRASSGPYYKGILQGHTTGPVPGQG